MTTRNFAAGEAARAAKLNRLLVENAATAAAASSAAILTAAAAAAAAAETAEIAAEAAAADAAISAVAAKGVVALTSVGGTLDGNGRCAAYTASSTVTPAAEVIFSFVPHAPNSAAPTLSVNGGTARALRAYDDTNLTQDTFQTGGWQFLRVASSLRYLALTNDIIHGAGIALRSATTKNFDFYVDDDAFSRGQLQGFTDGSFRLRLGGDGTATAANIIDFEDNGDIRMRVGQVRDIQNYPLYSLSNPPPFAEEHQEYVEMFPGRRDEATGRGMFINWSTPWCISGPDNGETLTVNSASGFIDLSGKQPEIEFNIETTASGACTIWGGDAGTTFVGGGVTRAMSADSLVKIICGRETIRAVLVDGAALTTPALVIPTYGRGMVAMGQSWSVRGSRNMLYGMQRYYNSIGLNRSVWSIHDAAVGASSFIEGGATNPLNYWWKQSTGTPGPNAIIARDAILASSRAPDFGVFIIGGNEYPALLPEPGGMSATDWAGHFVDFRDWLATEISNATFPIFMCPMGAQRAAGFIDETAIYALRYAQLHAATLSSYVHRGPDWYDIPRPDGIHMSWRGSAIHGERLAAYVSNEMEAQTNTVLPRVTAFARTAASTYQFSIDRGAGSPPFTRPANPLGFTVLPAGDLYGTPLTIRDTSWSGDNLIVYTSTDDAAAIGAYPYGSFDDAKQTSRLVRNYDFVTERYQALATYHPAV